jgi:membrane-bound ClpP family serine protease
LTSRADEIDYGEAEAVEGPKRANVHQRHARHVVGVMAQRRSWFRRLLGVFSSAEQGYELEDEDLDTFGTIVRVTQTVSPDHEDGRVELHGSTWKAMSISEEIPPERLAKVLFRQNLVWVVESYDGPLRAGEKDLA